MRSTWTTKWKTGQKTPEWKAINEEGNEITSQQLHGKKYILFFYNHDGSETCTKEACNVRDHFHLLSKLGYRVIGLSEDSVKKHKKFISKYHLPYSLISDVGNDLAKTFDIYGEKEFMGRTSDAVHRTTFMVNEDGVFEAVIHPVDSANHTQQILEAINISI